MLFTLKYGERGIYGNGKAWYLSVAYAGEKQTIATFSVRDDGYGSFKDDYMGRLWDSGSVIREADQMVSKMVERSHTPAQLDIIKMLTLSTAHIKKETAELFNAFEIPFDICIYDKEHYGWFLTDWDLSQSNDIPIDLLACLRFAEENGCQWLCFDCDGMTVSGLPTHVWEEK